MQQINRKSTPKVKGGKALRKNNCRTTPNYWDTNIEFLVIDQESPGKGYKHFVSKRDLKRFLNLIPQWEQISKGLQAILLASGEAGLDGCYYERGVIALTAWPKTQDIWVSSYFEQQHTKLFDRLGISRKAEGEGYYCHFSANQIKAYQLLHVFLHELGHHTDRMTTKDQLVCGRGESFAEDYAWAWEEKLWYTYQDAFNVIF